MIDIDRFKKVIIHPESLDSQVAGNFIDAFPRDRIEIGLRNASNDRKGRLSSEEFEESKKTIFIKPFPGKFFKRCPGAGPGLTCCNYFVLNLGLQCNMDCSYCYLQSFINSPTIEVYSNIEQALHELNELWPVDQTLRVGTGEVIDSLSLDPVTLYSRRLIDFFRTRPKWLLEFKTKSDFVDQFLDVEHSGNVVVSWSVNPQAIVAAEEHGTASLDQRLHAARKCRNAGYKISFHIDPMIYHSGWQDNYAELVEAIAQDFSPSEVPYVSVGALRFQPEQKSLMRQRFGFKSLAVKAEVFAGRDGKLRYDQNLREEMFRFVIGEFKKRNQNWQIFMCMETPETWLATYGEMPKSVDQLAPLFEGKRSLML